MTEVQDFLVLLKKNENINKKGFYNWKYVSALKLKTKRNYYVYKGVRLLHNTSLFKLKCF